MNAYERILVPLDGSALAEEVLAKAGQVLRGAREVILMKALGWPTGVARDPVVVDRAYDYLREVQMRTAAAGIRSQILVEIGATAPAILESAWREKVSLIAMTTHGRTGIRRWTFGSVAEKVLRASSVPLLMVRSFQQAEPAGGGIRRILVPQDGSELSCTVIPHAAALASSLGARLVLLHVFGRERPSAKPPEPKLALARAVEAASLTGVPFEQDFREGDAGEQILKAVEDQRADMIAMTTHGNSGVTRWLLGSVAEKVLRHATVPLLVVRNAATTAARDLVSASGATVR